MGGAGSGAERGSGVSGRFADKVALISGGGTGIGAAVARRLAQEGAKVVVMGRRQAQLDAVARAIKAEVVVGDAADPAQAAAAVQRAV